jgi:hypothetical protein
MAAVQKLKVVNAGTKLQDHAFAIGETVEQLRRYFDGTRLVSADTNPGEVRAIRMFLDQCDADIAKLYAACGCD